MFVSLKLKPSSYRKNDFFHPNPEKRDNLKYQRWELIFSIEDDDGEEYSLSVYATSFHNTDDEITEEGAIEFFKKMARITIDSILGEKSRKRLHELCVTEISEVDMVMISKFITLFDPDKKHFLINELGLIEEYKHLLYSNSKLIYLLLYGNHYGNYNNGISVDKLFEFIYK